MKTYNLFTPDECFDIIHILNTEYTWFNVVGRIRSHDKLTVDKDFKYYDRVRHLSDSIRGVKSYGVLHFLRYKTGDYYGSHIDKTPLSEFHHDAQFNLNCLLNTDYEGGQFTLKGKPVSVDIGSAYIYESSTIHEVTTVTSGVRYAMMYFVRDRDIIKQKQQLL